MSGKFMRIKRYLIPTITMVIIASQLMGCAATNDKELLAMLNNGQQIEIEVATPISEEQGQAIQLDWVRLDKLDTYKDFRDYLDHDLMNTVPFGDSKDGIAYIDLEGNQEGNNTLYNALQNKQFIKDFYENDMANLDIQIRINSVYSDLPESTPKEETMLAAINLYFNLLQDSEPGYFNPNSTISRLEALNFLARASKQVQPTEEIHDQAFTDAVGQSDFTDIASLVKDDSYLTLSNKSLNTDTANGTITRGEYIYSLIKNVFGAERMSKADIKKAQFNDCKQLSLQQSNPENTKKDFYESYELKIALENPDKGCPERMYKAIVTASELGIINSDTRWDEGLTKMEALQLYIDTIQAYTKENGYAVSAKFGLNEDKQETDTTDKEDTTDKQMEFNLIAMDKLMIAPALADIYENPSDESLRIGVVQKGEIVRAIGQVEGTNWFKIEQGDGIKEDIRVSFIDGKFITEYTSKEETSKEEVTTSKETTPAPKEETTSAPAPVQQETAPAPVETTPAPAPQEQTPPPVQQEQAPAPAPTPAPAPEPNEDPLKPGDLMGITTNGNPVYVLPPFDPSQW